MPTPTPQTDYTAYQTLFRDLIQAAHDAPNQESRLQLPDQTKLVLRYDGEQYALTLSSPGRNLFKVWEELQPHWPHVVDCRPIHILGISPPRANLFWPDPDLP